MSSVGLMGSSVCQGAVVPTMAIPPEKASQADLSLPAIATGVLVDLCLAVPRSRGYVLTCVYSLRTRMLAKLHFHPDKLILIASICSLATTADHVNWQPWSK
jgi:hypothetical protein